MELPGTFDERTIASAVVAVLQRYGQQRVLIDWCSASAAPRSLEISVLATETCEVLQRRVAQTLQAPAREAMSNVAVAVDRSAPEEGYELAIEVDTCQARLSARFDAETLQDQTAQSLVEAVARVVPALGTVEKVEQLPVLSAEALELVRADGPSAPLVVRPVHELFEAHARAQPQALACSYKQDRLTYAQLQRRSDQLARQLIKAQVGPGSKVAVCLLPSVDVVVSILGIFKAGAVYVPLDPTHPDALIAMMLEEASPRVVLTHRALTSKTAGHEQLYLEETPDDLEGERALKVDVCSGAYLLYTSGTTGRPKGVMATHSNLAHYLGVARQRYGFGPEDVFASIARYTFSISFFELLSPLCCGGALRLFDRDDVLDPQRFIRHLEGVTVLHAGPSLLLSLFGFIKDNPAAPKTLSHLRHVSSGGDIVSPAVIEEMKRVFDCAELFVIYGSTEVSCMACTYEIPRTQQARCSLIGRPFFGVQARIVDEGMALVPPGVIGELLIAGAGVVPGYYKRPELDEARFVLLDGRRYYRMGDLGRFDDDGNIEILGRADFQVKIRGIRVEPLGVENVIRERKLARRCAVVVRRAEQDVRLVAFLVEPAVDDLSALRAALSDTLPEYMLPQQLVTLPELPLTANGKLDRRQLQKLALEHQRASTGGAAPRDLFEQRVAQAFGEALGLSVGIEDDFFELGGHSLLAVALTQKLQNTVGLSIGPGALFERPTVRALVEYARGEQDEALRPILLTQQAPPRSLFLIAGVHLYRAVAKHLEGQYAVYGVYAGQELSLFEMGRAAPPVAQLAAQYIEIIRRVQPQGPYRLGGMSFGGIVVYEVAQQLRAAGHAVSFLGMLDAILPARGLYDRAQRVKKLLSLSRRSKLVWLGRRAAAKGRALLGAKRRAQFGQHADDAQLGAMEDLREEAYRAAALEYRRAVRPWPGSATLIVAGQRLQDNPLQPEHCGWSRHVRALGVHVITAGHLELLEEPWASEVARILVRALKESE